MHIQSITKPDLIGATSSTLCALHCMATPFIFIAQAGFVEAPEWYHIIDYFFIVISFAAIYYAAKNSSKDWMRIALWSTWSILLLAILNESLEVIHLPEASVYVPALVIAGLHLYNRKYCQCTEECCSPTTV